MNVPATFRLLALAALRALGIGSAHAAGTTQTSSPQLNNGHGHLWHPAATRFSLPA